MKTSKLKTVLIAILLLSYFFGNSQNTDPEKINFVTSDIDNFWKAYDQFLPAYNAEELDTYYLKKGSKGLKGFIKGRIENADKLAALIKKRPKYYASLRDITPLIADQEGTVKGYLAKMKEIYPESIFPDVYFVIGTMNSGGTTSKHGLIIGADMYGLTPNTPKDELSKWHLSVIRSVDEIPHIVVHELVHFQQRYDGGTLLAASIKEGAADFIAELVSGKHINEHVHDFANPKEEELWMEFKDRMLEKDFDGWLYGSQEGRPNDLGYWMGYKITRAYYENMPDKKKAIADIMRIKDFEAFLAASKYAEQFD